MLDIFYRYICMYMLPRMPWNSPKLSGTNLGDFLHVLGGNAARFFLGVFFGDFPSYFGVFSEFYLS